MNCACLCLIFCLTAYSQQAPVPRPYVPPELQAGDQDVRSLLTSAKSKAEAGEYESAFADSKSALELAEKKGLLGDRAIAEAYVAQGYFASAKLDESFKYYQASLQHALAASNLALQADVLVALSALPQLQDNLPEALDLLAKAKDRANQSQNLYVRARALGELGRLQLASGKIEQGRQSVEDALNIDRVNRYPFEPLHLVYSAYAAIALPEPDFPKAITLLTSARDLAVKNDNYAALVQAQNALAAVYLRTGNVQKGIAICEAMLKGNVLIDDQTLSLGDAFRTATSLPFVKSTLLEALAQGYEAARDVDNARSSWNDLYQLSVASNFTVALAESASKLANIYNAAQNIPDAMHYYDIAIRTWRILHNTQQLAQTLASEALLLMRSGRGEDAIPLETEVVDIAETTHNTKALFTANGVLAEIYQPLGKFQEARRALERATALITAGKGDADFAPNTVIEDYTLLADDYRALQIPVKEMVAIENAIAVLRNLKDEQSAQQLQRYIAYLKARFDTLQVHDLAAKAINDGKFTEALAYSEIIYVFEGVSANPETDTNWSRILNLPSQILRQPGGPGALNELLVQMEPLLGIANLPLLDALATHFLSTDLQPSLAERYAGKAETIAQLSSTPETIQLRPKCQLSIAHARQGRIDVAKQKLAECLASAEHTHDSGSIVFAEVTDVLVHLALNDVGPAESSLKSLLTKIPDSPDLHLELALALVTNNTFDEAAAEFNRAIKMIEAKADENAEGIAFSRMAAALASSATPQYRKQRLEYLTLAAQHFKKSNNTSQQAVAAIEIGLFFVNAGDQKAALSYFEQAYALGQEYGNRQVSARAASQLGGVHNALRDYQAAGDFHQRAANTYHDVGDTPQEAMTLVLLAEDLEAQGQLDGAIAISRRAEDLAFKSSATLASFWAKRTLGDLYRTQGDFDNSVVVLIDAATVAAHSGQTHNEAAARLAVASLYMILGQWDNAANAATRALDMYKVLTDKQGQASAYSELANIYGSRTSSLKDFARARDYYSEAAKLGADIQLDLVEMYYGAGHFAEAIAAAKVGIQQCIQAHNSLCQAVGLADLSEAERKNGDLAKAASSLKEAMHLTADVKDVYLQGSLLYRQAGQRRAEGDLEAASKTYREVISLIERAKSQGSVNAQRSLSENYGYIYDELVSTIYSMSVGKSERDRTELASQALRYTETNKAREFANSWGRTFVTELRRALPGDLQELERALLARRDEVRTVAGDATPNSHAETFQNDLAKFVADLRISHPQYATIAYPEEVTLDSIPLQRAETFIEFKVMEESALVWVIRKSPGNKNELLHFYEVLKPRKWFEEKVLRLRDALNSPQPRPELIDWHNSEDLFAELFPDPAAKTLLASTSIVFVPDDVLSVIPLELLSPEASKGKFPLLGIPTSYFPSAATLRLARTATQVDHWPAAFLGLGDPITSDADERYDLASVLSTSSKKTAELAMRRPEPTANQSDLATIHSRGYTFERLPATAAEVEGIAGLFQKKGEVAEVRLGADATMDRLIDTDLTRFRFVHFATHGILPVDSNIKEPALVLSFDGSSSEHMLLSMSEILGLKIHADTVVLSACNTGSGAVSHAEGVMSLGRAFMAAGAGSVTVSLWQVSDESTQLFMQKYYEQLINGKSKAEALSVARSYLFADDRFSSPFYWAPFVLIGN